MAWRQKFRSGCLVIWGFCAAIARGIAGANASELVTVYPAYAYEQEESWVIPMRLWVHEDRPTMQSLVGATVSKLHKLNAAELKLLNFRIRNFVADSESEEIIELQFADDPQEEVFRLSNELGQTVKSDRNGLVLGTLRLSVQRAAEIASRQESTDGWLRIKVTSSSHQGEGLIFLMPSEGLSVISDVDDTIKVTQIPAGSSTVIRNTFLRPFVAAPEMAMRYQQWKDASFHYVSGSPWQLYEPLSQFAEGPDGQYPRGTWHMKTVTKNLLSGDTWNSLGELVMNENVTRDQKLSQISEIVGRFPKRRFILVGDSGEKDPEVYREIKTRFPQQIQEIWIRDVVNDRENRPERLREMQIIPAETIVPETTQPPAPQVGNGTDQR